MNESASSFERVLNHSGLYKRYLPSVAPVGMESVGFSIRYRASDQKKGNRKTSNDLGSSSGLLLIFSPLLYYLGN